MSKARPFEPRPLEGLELLESPGQGCWHALGESACFELAGTAPRAGWHLLAIDMESLEQQPLAPWLTAERADSEVVDRIELPFAPGGTLQRIPVFLPAGASRLLLHPHGGSCRFRLGRISLRRIAMPELFLRLGWPVLRRRLSAGRGLAALSRVPLWLLRNRPAQGLAAVIQARSAGPDYAAWLGRFGGASAAELEWMGTCMATMAEPPLLSVLMPVYDTPERLLRAAIDSVLAQVYPHWELCVANDGSGAPHVKQVLDEYAANDRRIKVCHRDRNGQISEASNSALQLANGRFIALLDHDDELPADALFWVAHRLQAEPRLKLLYSDEDKIDADGRRFDPYFKPDWNPDLFRSQNMVSHLGVYDTELVRQLGGFRKGFEGSQDYDLALRCCEAVDARQIGHIPRVLYHWRAIPGSTALDQGEKSYARGAARRALQEHLARTRRTAAVEDGFGGFFRVRHALPSPAPLVSIVIPTRDRLQLLSTCVSSVLAKTRYTPYEILIVDNGSVDPDCLAWMDRCRQEHSCVRVLRDEREFNFSALNNRAIDEARGEVVVLLNNDVEAASEDWLDEMVSQAMRPEIGAVGAMLYYPDERIQHAGVVVGYLGVAGHAYQAKPRGFPGQMGRARLVQNVSAVTGACLAVRRQTYQLVGGLDEDLAVAFNDVDFCLRLERAGFRNLWTPYAELYHHESASRGYEDSEEKLRRFRSEVAYMQRRWGQRLQLDPAYNPNLALAGDPYTLDFTGAHRERLRLLGMAAPATVPGESLA